MYLMSSLWSAFLIAEQQSHFFLKGRLESIAEGVPGSHKDSSLDSFFFSPGLVTTPALLRIGLRNEA
jgi:hypothetical protein